MRRFRFDPDPVLTQKSAQIAPPVMESHEEISERNVQQFEAICGLVDRVGADLAQENILTEPQKLSEWIETLQWAVKLLPEGYETSRLHLLGAIENPQVSDFDVSNKAKNAL